MYVNPFGSLHNAYFELLMIECLAHFSDEKHHDNYLIFVRWIHSSIRCRSSMHSIVDSAIYVSFDNIFYISPSLGFSFFFVSFKKGKRYNACSYMLYLKCANAETKLQIGGTIFRFVLPSWFVVWNGFRFIVWTSFRRKEMVNFL